MNIAKKILAAYTFLVVFGLSIIGVFVYATNQNNVDNISTQAAVLGTTCCTNNGNYYASSNCEFVPNKKLNSYKESEPNGTGGMGGIKGQDGYCGKNGGASNRIIANGYGLSCNAYNWEPTSAYGACSVTCGGGTQSLIERNSCGDTRSVSRSCNTQACPPSNTAPTITQWQLNSAGHSNFDIFNRQSYYVTVGAERVAVLGGNSNVSAQFADANNNLITAARRLDYVSALITDPATVTTTNPAGIAQARYDLPLNTATSTGDAVVRFSATDAANALTNATQNVIIDNIVPTATFVAAPTEGATVSGTVNIEANFQDNIGLFRYMIGIHTVSWNCNVGPENNSHDSTNTPTNGVKSCVVDTAALANGNHVITISAIDKAGNISAINHRNIVVQNNIVIIDNVSPTSILRYIGLNSAGYGSGDSLTGAFTNEANVRFEVTATDATSAISKIDYRCTTDGVFDASNAIENWTLVSSSSGASPLTIQFNVVGLSDDSYTCETRATDAANNNEVSPFSNNVEVNADRAVPAVSFTSNTPVENAMLNNDFTIEVNVDGTFADDTRLNSIYIGVFKKGSYTVGQWCLGQVVNQAAGIRSCVIDISAFLLNDGSSLVEGEYDIWVSVQDKAVNQTNIRRGIVIDGTVSPVVYEWGFDVPPANYVANSGTGLTRHVTCEGFINNTNPYRGLWAVPTDASGIVSYERDVVYNGSFVGSFTNSTNYTSIFTTQVGTNPNGGQGVYYVRVRAVDGAGNKSISDLQWSVKTPNSSWCKMTIDLVAPVTVLNAYTTNPTTSSAITFTGNVNDNLTNITNVEYRYSSDAGSTWSTWTNVTPNDAFDSLTEGFSFTTSVLADGNYIFQTRGTDLAGNTETFVNDASQQTLLIASVTDNQAPVIALNGFRDLPNGSYATTNPIKTCGSFNSTGFIAWEWTLSNTETDPVTYTYRITSGPTAVGYTTTTSNTHYYGGIPAQGTYTVEVYGTDSAGNTGTPVQCSVIFDSTAPVTVLDSQVINPTSDNTPTFTGTTTDNLTNITNVEYRYSNNSGNTWSAWTNTDGVFDSTNEPFSFTTPILIDGNYIFQTRATDSGGNVEIIIDDASQQTIVIDTSVVVAPTPVATIDDSFAQIVNGYACGWGDARNDDGLRVNISNWNSDMAIQGRYFTQGGSFSSWFNLTSWGSLNVTGNNAMITVHHTGVAPVGNAGWEVRVIDTTDSSTISNIDSLNYIITQDRDSLACNGSVTLGFETAENSSQTGVGQCNVITADASQQSGTASTQVLRWEAVDFATSYRLNGFSLNGSNWVTSYTNYTIPNANLDLVAEPGYVIYSGWATGEATYAYEITAVDALGNEVGLSPSVSSGSACTFTVNRTPVAPVNVARLPVSSSSNIVVASSNSSTRINLTKVNLIELIRNFRFNQLTR